jgi:hypothetical protein
MVKDVITSSIPYTIFVIVQNLMPHFSSHEHYSEISAQFWKVISFHDPEMVFNNSSSENKQFVLCSIIKVIFS